jgi:hypothetical protein
MNRLLVSFLNDDWTSLLWATVVGQLWGRGFLDIACLDCS